jgi:hypothetical protein
MKGERLYPVEKKKANGRAPFDGVGLMTWRLWQVFKKTFDGKDL